MRNRVWKPGVRSLSKARFRVRVFLTWPSASVVVSAGRGVAARNIPPEICNALVALLCLVDPHVAPAISTQGSAVDQGWKSYRHFLERLQPPSHTAKSSFLSNITLVCHIAGIYK